MKHPMTTIVRSTSILLLPGLALFTLLGCGQSDRPALGKVSGTVSYRGKAIADGMLIIEVRGARSAYGKIVAGKIVEVTTFKTGDGAPLGKALIAVFATEPENPAASTGKTSSRDKVTPGYMSGKSRIPAKYNDPSTSGLTHEIAAGENVLALDLQ